MKQQNGVSEFVRQADGIRTRLIEYAATHTVDELLTKVLDEITTLAETPIIHEDKAVNI